VSENALKFLLLINSLFPVSGTCENLSELVKNLEIPSLITHQKKICNITELKEIYAILKKPTRGSE
jgi:hypothetical protein